MIAIIRSYNQDKTRLDQAAQDQTELDQTRPDKTRLDLPSYTGD